MKTTPRRDRPHPDFDGHLERPWRELTPEQRLHWIWTTMEIARDARRQREAKRSRRAP